MANSKVSALTALSTVASGDLLYVVDISDTSDGSGGSGRAITRANLLLGFATLASPTFTGTVTIPTPFTLGAVSVTATGTEFNILAGATLSTAELNFVDGVTSAIQTQIDGKQPLDADLTTIAGLTATTDNFIVSVASAWASRTPAQVRTTLGLVIGTNVQAWDADLDTLSGKTIPSGGTLADTSSAQSFTTKTMTDTSNNVTAKSLHSATTVVDVVAATAPSTGQVLMATDSTHATWQTPAAGGAVNFLFGQVFS